MLQVDWAAAAELMARLHLIESAFDDVIGAQNKHLSPRVGLRTAIIAALLLWSRPKCADLIHYIVCLFPCEVRSNRQAENFRC